MKIALVCPSNILYMPYVRNYTIILKELGVDYDIINWDRFNIEEQSEFVYRDLKIGHQRGFLDYFKYSRFIVNLLKKNKYEKVIIFGIQLVFFIKKFLIKKYSNEFIIDIRDYNRIVKYFNIRKVIDNSAFTVLSSPGYREWLSKKNKYIINHNTTIENLDQLREVKHCYVSGERISVGCIGALRDYKINIDLIGALKNKEFIQLNYHGEGDINKDISKYLIENNVDNVNLTGRYAKEEEETLYYKNNIINVLRYNDGINNKTALPNRLYNAAICGKPMLALKGTYLSEIIKKYNLGLVIESFLNTEDTIMNYVNGFSDNLYEEGRKSFFEGVLKENNEFRSRIVEFVN